MFNKRRFTKSATSRTRSPLLRLPAELRFKVLRNLLQTSRMIRMKQHARNSEESNEAYSTNTSLSGQMLSCCQQLFMDGIQILYGENTLEIACVHSAKDGVLRKVLDGQIPIPPNEKGLPFEALGAFEWRDSNAATASLPTQSDLRSKYGPSRLVNRKAGSALFIQKLSAVLSFKALHVTLQINNAEKLFVACRV